MTCLSMPVDAYLIQVAAREYLDEQDKPKKVRRTLSTICRKYGLYHDPGERDSDHSRLGEVLDIVADLREER